MKQLCLKFFCNALPGYDENALKSLTKNRKITPLDHIDYPMDTSIDLDEYLKGLALKQKPKVIVPKLNYEVIQLLTGEHWTSIDPYLDLEEVGSSVSALSEDSEDIPNNWEEPSGVYFQMAGGHCLRKWKRSYSIDHSQCASSKDKFYRGLCKEKPPRKPLASNKKSAKQGIPGMREPSKIRIQAQKTIEAVNHLRCKGLRVRNHPVCSYSVYQPIKPKEEPNKQPKNTDDVVDSDATEILPDPIETSETPDVPNEPILKCSVKTKSYKLKRPRSLSSPTTDKVKKIRKRNYHCPVCNVNHSLLASLNEHYKLQHSPLTCGKCDQAFCTRVPWSVIVINTEN